MADTPTPRNRWRKQEVGAKQNAWGPDQNEDAGSDRIDESVDGVVSFVLSGAYTLTSVNFEADEARRRVINVTGGTGGTLTIPGVEKNYLVRNATSGDLTITNGSNSVTVKSGNGVPVFTDGTNMYQLRCLDYGTDLPKSSGTPSNAADLVTKAYADELAFTTTLPGQSGNAGKALTTNGAIASWNYIDLAANVTGVLPVANGGTGTGSLATLKTSLSLNLVENKTSATIRAEFVAAANTYTAKQTFKASASGGAGVNLGVGGVPTVPVAGDFWATSSGLSYYDGSRTLNLGQMTQIGSNVATTSGSSVTLASIPSYYSDLVLLLKGASGSALATWNIELSDNGTNWTSTWPMFTSVDAATALYGAIVISGYCQGTGLIMRAALGLSNRSINDGGTSKDTAWRVDAPITHIRLSLSAGSFDAGAVALFGR